MLAIPPKRHDKALVVTYPTEPEHALILLAAQTGLRVSELTRLTIGDLHLGTGAHVSCTGKGRKQRVTPLTAATVSVLRTWLVERGGGLGQPLFPARTGGRLGRDAIEYRLAKHTGTASARCLSRSAKSVTVHTLRQPPPCGCFSQGLTHR